jgi:hypothetical protein
VAARVCFKTFSEILDTPVGKVLISLLQFISQVLRRVSWRKQKVAVAMSTGSDNPHIGRPDLQGPGARGFGVPVRVLRAWPEPLEEVEALRAAQAATTTDAIPTVATGPLHGHTVARCASALATRSATAGWRNVPAAAPVDLLGLAVNPLAHFAPPQPHVPQPHVVAECIPQIEPDLEVAK